MLYISECVLWGKQEVVASEKVSLTIWGLRGEGRVLKQLKEFRELGDPFTDTQSIYKFLADEGISADNKRKRMEQECIVQNPGLVSQTISNEYF